MNLRCKFFGHAYEPQDARIFESDEKFDHQVGPLVFTSVVMRCPRCRDWTEQTLFGRWSLEDVKRTEGEGVRA